MLSCRLPAPATSFFPSRRSVAESRGSGAEYNLDMRSFDSLTEREILALAVSLEEDDERIYADFADGLRENYPSTAEVFEEMRVAEADHRRRLIETFRA